MTYVEDVSTWELILSAVIFLFLFFAITQVCRVTFSVRIFLVTNVVTSVMTLLKMQAVMKSTRRQLERELLLEDVTRLEDLSSYGLLCR